MNIIITGASRGIGYELVKKLSGFKEHKIIAIARNAEKLEQLKKECEAFGNNKNVFILPLDLSAKNSEKQIIPAITTAMGHVDILINNAATLINKPFEKITADELEQVYKINVFSVFKLIQDCLPFFNKNERSHIINISSMGGITGTSKFPGLSAYSSSKGALAILSECLAEELRSKNIAVNCLCLGATNTEMLQQAFPDFKAPLSAVDMAEFIAQFAVSGMKYFNGKTLPVSLSTP